MERKEIPRIEMDDLVPCDVLLCAGRSWIAREIERLDGGLYSHAVLYAESGIHQGAGVRYVVDPTRDNAHGGVAFATLANLWHREVAAPAVKHRDNPPYIDVYRCTMPLTAETRSTILRNAERFARDRDRYATGPLSLLALFLLMRRVRRRDARRFRHAIEELIKLLNTKRTPLTSSEFIYRCFAEAGVNLGPTVLSLAHCATRSHPPVADQHGLPDVWDRLHQRLQRRWDVTRGSAVTPLGESDIDPAFVTPHDLQTASTLRLVGRLAMSVRTGDPRCADTELA